MGSEAVPIQRRGQSCIDIWLASKPSWLLRVQAPRRRVIANRFNKVLNALNLLDTWTRHSQTNCTTRCAYQGRLIKLGRKFQSPHMWGYRNVGRVSAAGILGPNVRLESAKWAKAHISPGRAHLASRRYLVEKWLEQATQVERRPFAAVRQVATSARFAKSQRQGD